MKYLDIPTIQQIKRFMDNYTSGEKATYVFTQKQLILYNALLDIEEDDEDEYE